MRLFKFSLLALLIFSQSFAFAHTRFRADGPTPPRNNNAGLKTGPCGGVPRTANPATLVAGETITVTWEETIQHPGHFEFYFSRANDANFELLKMVPDHQDDANTVPHQYSTTLVVPSVPCEACTLQLIQVMTENPSSPRPYFSCADIKILPSPATPVPTPTATPSPSPTPSPGPGATATPTPSPTASPTPALSTPVDPCHQT